MTDDRISYKKCVWARAISAVALAGFAITAGGCLSVPSASVAPNDLSSGHTVLLIGDSLMGGAAMSLNEVMDDSRSGGISVVDAHRNGSGLVRLMDGMLPADFVEAQFQARPDIDVVAMQWAGACEKPCPEYGTPEFFRQWLDNAAAVARGRQRARRRAHRRAAPAATTGFLRAGLGIRVHRVGREHARVLLGADERCDTC